eukprot:g5848.t1
MEAVKQGSCAVGLKVRTQFSIRLKCDISLQSKEYVVLATLKRSQSELSFYQRKVFKIDDHLGIAISGLTADGRILCKYMRSACLDYRFVYEAPMPVGRLVRRIADKSQRCTQFSHQRPYGVGLLVAGFDKSGPCLMQTCPSGNYYEYHAYAIGLRSQASKTYLEKKFNSFDECDLDGLIRHGLKALESSIQEGELNAENCTVAVVGKDMPFTLIEGDALLTHITAARDEDVEMADAGEAVEDDDEMDVS